MNPDARPMLQLLRSDVVLKLFKDGDSYTLAVSRLRKAPETLNGLTAAEALDKLAAEMGSEGGP